MKADGTVYVPSRMPVRAKLKSSDKGKSKSKTAETNEALIEAPANSETPANITTASTVETTVKKSEKKTSGPSDTTDKDKKNWAKGNKSPKS